MAFQKFSADELFDGYGFRAPGSVLVMDHEATVVEIIDGSDAGDDVQRLDGILSPGFINCHCHLELSHMKGMIAKGTGLVGFVQQVMGQRHVPVEEIMAAISIAADEMYASGISAVGDICNTAFTVEEKSSGRLRYHNFIEVSGFTPGGAETRFAAALSVCEAFAGTQSSITPHAPYSVSKQLFQKIIGYPGNQLLSLHNQEDEAETAFFLDKTGRFIDLYAGMNIDLEFFEAPGMSSLQTVLPYFKPSQTLLLVHDVFTTRADLDFVNALAVKPGLSWCLCPGANQYINGILPDVKMLNDEGLDIVLGTDSLASNDQLSIVSEMAILKTNWPSLSLTDLFTWATSNGAKALSMDDQLGSLGKGKRPGLVLVSEGLKGSRRIL